MVDSIIKSAKLVKSESVVAKNTDKVFSLNIGQETDKAQVTCPTTIDEELKTTFDLKYFERISKALGLIFDMSIGGDMPSKFMEKSDKHNLLIYMTPVSESG
jgi:hypothetical protein